jgi:hypothetical protein
VELLTKVSRQDEIGRRCGKGGIGRTKVGLKQLIDSKVTGVKSDRSLYWKSPSDRDTARLPHTRFISMNPPAARTRACIGGPRTQIPNVERSLQALQQQTVGCRKEYQHDLRPQPKNNLIWLKICNEPFPQGRSACGPLSQTAPKSERGFDIDKVQTPKTVRNQQSRQNTRASTSGWIRKLTHLVPSSIHSTGVARVANNHVGGCDESANVGGSTVVLARLELWMGSQHVLILRNQPVVHGIGETFRTLRTHAVAS